MDKEFIEKIRSFYELNYQLRCGADSIAVVSETEPGNYDNNPTIAEYTRKGYKLIDTFMFSRDNEQGEILIFRRKE